MIAFKCPVCRAKFRGEVVCKRCKTDLTPLTKVIDRAVLYYNQALENARQNRWDAALSNIASALAWHKRDEFYNLRAVILERIAAK